MPSMPAISMRSIVTEISEDCKTHFAAFFWVELGAADIVLLDCSGDCASVVVTVGEAVHII